MARKPQLLNETPQQKADRLAEEARLKEQRTLRLKKRLNKFMSGNGYTGKLPHETFSSEKVYQRQINAYFELCEIEHEPQTVPGLALALGLRTTELTQYSPPPDKVAYKRLTAFALQRIERYMAIELSRGTGNTKGKEFLAQNTLNYANKSQVNAQTSLEVTERDRLKDLSDEEVVDRTKHAFGKILRYLPKELMPEDGTGT